MLLVTLCKDKTDMLLRLAASLEKYTSTEDDVAWIVVDNGGWTDSPVSKKLFKTCKRVQLIIVRHDNSGNFSAQNNWIVREYGEGADYVIFLNDDMEFRTPYFWIHPYFEQVPKIGVIGAVLAYPDDSLQHAGIGFQINCVPFNIGKIAVQGLELDADICHPGKWPSGAKGFSAVTGAFMALRKRDFDALGGFDETFNWCFEDVDLCLRAWSQLGLSSVCSRDICLTHYESSSGGNRRVRDNLDVLQGRWQGRIREDVTALRGHPIALKVLPGPNLDRVFEPDNVDHSVAPVTPAPGS